MMKEKVIEYVTQSSLYTPNIIDDDSIFAKISRSLESISEGIGSFGEFCGKVGEIFKTATHWLAHPIEFINVYMSYIMVAAIALLVLKKLGFNTGKWLSLVMLAMLIALVC